MHFARLSVVVVVVVPLVGIGLLIMVTAFAQPRSVVARVAEAGGPGPYPVRHERCNHADSDAEPHADPGPFAGYPGSGAKAAAPGW